MVYYVKLIKGAIMSLTVEAKSPEYEYLCGAVGDRLTKQFAEGLRGTIFVSSVDSDSSAGHRAHVKISIPNSDQARSDLNALVQEGKIKLLESFENKVSIEIVDPSEVVSPLKSDQADIDCTNPRPRCTSPSCDTTPPML